MFLSGETVTRLRAPLVTDRYGNVVRDWTSSSVTELPMPDCGVAPRTSEEDTERGRQGVVVGISVYDPHYTDVTAHDRLRVRGDVYEVEGEIAVWRSPFTGWQPGTVINLTRMEG